MALVSIAVTVRGHHCRRDRIHQAHAHNHQRSQERLAANDKCDPAGHCESCDRLAYAGNHPSFWYFATLALILGANLVMLAGLMLSFPIFDVHRKSESRE
ncbi:MAG: hypothetical protein ACPHDP_03150 [Pseudohongiellaceae bacterium]